jgi:hypothetical protein
MQNNLNRPIQPPKADRAKIKSLMSTVEQENALVFKGYKTINFRYPENFEDDVIRLDPPEYLLQLSMMSREEYDRIFKDEANRAQSEGDWGEGMWYFNSRMVTGPGETSVTIEGKTEEELSLLEKLHNKWQKRMRKFGQRAFYGMNEDGTGRLTPRDGLNGPFTITITNPDGTLFEHTYEHGIKKIDIR